MTLIVFTIHPIVPRQIYSKKQLKAIPLLKTKRNDNSFGVYYLQQSVGTSDARRGEFPKSVAFGGRGVPPPPPHHPHQCTNNNHVFFHAAAHCLIVLALRHNHTVGGGVRRRRSPMFGTCCELLLNGPRTQISMVYISIDIDNIKVRKQPLRKLHRIPVQLLICDRQGQGIKLIDNC